jgi:hypothetical protein
MNWKKLQTLYDEAWRIGEKKKAIAYVELVLDELRQKQCSVLDFSGGAA